MFPSPLGPLDVSYFLNSNQTLSFWQFWLCSPANKVAIHGEICENGMLLKKTISTNHSIGSWIFVLLWFSILTKLEKSKIIKVKRFQAAVQEDIGIKSKMISCFFLIIWGFVLVFNIDLHLITNLAIHRDLSQETS